MSNFKINFQHPWLLLLLIPAVALTLFFYFRSAKKYRRNRNRITSMVLHLIVSVLCISVFAGITFSYSTPNVQNQIVILVDMSDSNGSIDSRRDGIVADILAETRSEYSVGVVTFGYDQVLASPMSTNSDAAYRNYISAPLPDTSATDIAAAFAYAKTLFKSGGRSKIVLISDGLETDGDAMATVLSVASEGITVDTVSLDRPEFSEVEIVSVEVPDYNVAVGDPFRIALKVKSSIEGVTKFALYDNNERMGEAEFYAVPGVQELSINYQFATNGMHSLRFEVSNDNDGNTDNNTYYSYIQIAVCDRVLIIERNTSEADKLAEILRDNTGYTVDVLNVYNDEEKIPTTVDGLRQYDEVILNNIANADMPKGFDELLRSYVYNHGGGLFTVGGNNERDEANTYKESDMRGTVYQQMLPVQAINYTPPLGIMFLVDASGSMYDTDSSGSKLITIAKQAVEACVSHSLSERDYCGICVLGDPAMELINPIPVPQRQRIISSLERISEEGTMSSGTPFGSSISYAGKALSALANVQKRHMVVISDGEPTDTAREFSQAIEECGNKGITITIVNIGGSNSYEGSLRRALGEGTDNPIGQYIQVTDINQLTGRMRQLLEAPEIKEVNYETFTPTINEHTSVVNGITQEDMPTLDGFYGTKLKEDATMVLAGEYVPIYAQWKYGEGSVGSFMCNLGGTWSDNFVKSATGQTLVKNIVSALFPSKNIRPSEIDVRLSYQNYSTVMSIYTELNENEKIEAVYKTDSGEGETLTPIEMNPDNGYTRATFAITKPGIHEVVVRKVDGEGNVLATSSVYRVLSYSAEYDLLTDVDGNAFMAEIAQKGKGTSIGETWEIFEGFQRLIVKTFDPKLIFCLIALILFLLDIAVRKFKFKWIHELVRERMEKTRRSEVKHG